MSSGGRKSERLLNLLIMLLVQRHYIAKDRIRELQELRKSTGLEVSDRISVVISVPAQHQEWAQTHRDLIAGEILATSFEFGEPDGGAEIGDGVRVAITKA